MTSYRRAASVSAMLALCALTPVTVLPRAYGHTLPESYRSEEALQNNLEASLPNLPTVAPASSGPVEVTPGTVKHPLQPLGSLPLHHLADELVTIHGVACPMSVIQTQETGHASIYLNHKEIIKFRADAQDLNGQWQTPSERALKAYNVLKDFLQNGGQPGEIEAANNQGHFLLVARDQVIAEVDGVTARQSHVSTQALALLWVNQLKRSIAPVEGTTAILPLFKTATPVVKSADLPVVKATVGHRIATGMASWYGPGFHGRKAANGSVYNQFEMTAAHKSLPFGSMVRVINKQNGRQCIVRITDRGPYAHNRVIDLSRKAAERIGMLGSGVAMVHLELIASNPNH